MANTKVEKTESKSEEKQEKEIVGYKMMVMITNHVLAGTSIKIMANGHKVDVPSGSIIVVPALVKDILDADARVIIRPAIRQLNSKHEVMFEQTEITQNNYAYTIIEPIFEKKLIPASNIIIPAKR